jgi:hypothetical protein
MTWEQMVENGRKTSPAQILNEEYESFFGRPKVKLRAGHCPKCNTALEIGLGLQGQEKDPNVRAEYTHHTNRDLEFKRCLKCPNCGFSETL